MSYPHVFHGHHDDENWHSYYWIPKLVGDATTLPPKLGFWRGWLGFESVLKRIIIINNKFFYALLLPKYFIIFPPSLKNTLVFKTKKNITLPPFEHILSLQRLKFSLGTWE